MTFSIFLKILWFSHFQWFSFTFWHFKFFDIFRQNSENFQNFHISKFSVFCDWIFWKLEHVLFQIKQCLFWGLLQTNPVWKKVRFFSQKVSFLKVRLEMLWPRCNPYETLPENCCSEAVLFFFTFRYNETFWCIFSGHFRRPKLTTSDNSFGVSSEFSFFIPANFSYFREILLKNHVFSYFYLKSWIFKSL